MEKSGLKKVGHRHAGPSVLLQDGMHPCGLHQRPVMPCPGRLAVGGHALPVVRHQVHALDGILFHIQISPPPGRCTAITAGIGAAAPFERGSHCTSPIRRFLHTHACEFRWGFVC